MNKLATALQWRDDVASGEMIETFAYTRTYLGFNQISQQELNAICDAANLYYTQMDSPLRISNSMGELIPGLAPQRKLI